MIRTMLAGARLAMGAIIALIGVISCALVRERSEGVYGVYGADGADGVYIHARPDPAF
ncbi:MAG: hypothetical protein HPY52_09915 [Firmicutes bacterium]|nr:hypothetical protein [Bacillota bacterium]